MNHKKKMLSLFAGALLTLASACSTDEAASDTTAAATETVAAAETTVAAAETAATTETVATDTTTAATTAETTAETTAANNGGGPGGGASVDSVTTVDGLVSLINEAYGEASLGLHRGHQDVESILIEVLGISHDEMHVRMETQGQNLETIANDLGLDPQTLIDALVDSRQPAIDSLLAAGTITADEAAAYQAVLVEAYTYRVTWNGSDATPTFAGL